MMRLLQYIEIDLLPREAFRQKHSQSFIYRTAEASIRSMIIKLAGIK